MISYENNLLYIDGCSAVDLAEEYGTPLLVLSEDHIRSKCREIRETFLTRYPGTRAAYAAKAFLCLEMCRIIQEEGLCLDAVSGGELYTAIQAGFPADRIEFNGNNKSKEEIRMAVDYGVGRIIIDGVDELDLIEEVCRELGKKTDALLRISPGVDSHTHEFITTGNIDSKFGIPLDPEIFSSVFRRALSSQYVNLLGFHYHVGSQLHDNESHLKATVILLDLIRDLKRTYGYNTSEINIGGGFGIRYTDEDDEKPYAYFLDPIMAMIQEAYSQMGLKHPAVVIEPGRSIVGNAGITLYRVGTVKDIPGVRRYVSVDGGMTDNIRPALYDARYECVLANRSGSAATAVSPGSTHGEAPSEESELVTISGKCCESGDILIRDVRLPSPKRGDLLAIFSTGAYCASMASNYNKLPFLPVVMTNQSREKGQHRLVVRRQTYQDLISRDI